MKLPWKIPLRFAGAILAGLVLLSSGAYGTTSDSHITDMVIKPVDSEVELAVDGSIEYGYFPLSNPQRLVFDFPGAILDYNNGLMTSEIVPGDHFSEVIISQYSVDPPITRLVFHVNDGVDAIVNFDPNNGLLVIRLSDEPYESAEYSTDGRISNLIIDESQPVLEDPVQLRETPIEEVEVMSESPAQELTEEIRAASRETYQVVSSQTDALFRFPGLLPDQIQTTQRRFPDRLSIRLFLNEDSLGQRPRFDLLERGNIWNGLAKQWTSYIDRDGRGIVDLIVYLYPDVSFDQLIEADGTPAIVLKPAEPVDEPTIVEPDVPEVLSDLEVSSYEPEPVEDEAITGAELFQNHNTVEETEESAIDEEIIEPEPVIEEEVSTDETTVIEEESESTGGVEVIDEPAFIIETKPVDVEGTVEIIEEGDSPLGAEVGTPDPNGMIAEADLHGTTDIDKLPIVLTTSDLLQGEALTGTPEPLHMMVGEVYLLKVPGLIRASVGDPTVVTLNVVSLDEVLVTALAPGVTTLLVWSGDHGYISRMVTVGPSNMATEDEISKIIDNDNVSVTVVSSGSDSGNGVILEGTVNTTEERQRASDIAALFAGQDRVTNLVEVTDPSQVLVKVRVVEVDKRALDDELSHFSAGGRADNDDFTFNIITDLLDPENPGGGLFDNRVRPGVINGDTQDVVFDPVDIVLNELETNRQANILSEPNLVTMSGEEAHFRVGGEVPYTYLNENGITVVEFKEFGVSLDMTPEVDSQHNILLDIKPVVRTVDMALAIAGIPGFRTREMETTVQLRPGETLVIGGLIQNEITQIVSKVPVLGDIPILGELFKSTRFNNDETELVIFLSPYLIEEPYDSAVMVDIEPETDFIDYDSPMPDEEK